jgi:ribosomal protein S13
MSRQVTLTLSNELYEQARRWAAVTQQDLPDALEGTLSIALPSMADAPQVEKSVTSLSDEEITALCETQMDQVQGQRLSRLLDMQREGTLSDEERRELQALVQVYNYRWIRQSRALVEAVRRGLREPLAP